jgi:hypothetical protein
MASKNKLSTTGQGLVSPIVSYASGKEPNDVAEHLIKIIPDGFVGGSFKTSSALEFSDLPGTPFDDPDPLDPPPFIPGKPGPGGPTIPGGPKGNPLERELPGREVFPGWDAPTLFDVELVSNSVVYSADGKPSVTVVFKVKVNEIAKGRGVTGVNARVQVL